MLECLIALLLVSLAKLPARAALTDQGSGSGPNRLNIALGRPYTLDPRPSYEHCTDSGDVTQLTDGKLTEGYFWTQRGTVGWVHTNAARVTIDLGKVEPISGVSFRTAAGVAGVGWPAQLLLFVSEDGKTYHVIGDLIDLSAGHGLPEAVGYRVHTYWTDQLRTKGRYVQVVIVLGSSYAFCDEIEVWRGDDAWLAQPIGGQVIGDVPAYLNSTRAATCVRRRLRMDAAAVRKAIEDSKMPAEKRDAALKKLDELVQQIARLDVPDPKKLTAVVPINDLHAKILACHAEVLQARGLKGLVVWQNNRWDPLSILDAPEAAPSEPPKLSARLMMGEYRGCTLNLTNAGDQTWRGVIHVRGLPVAQFRRPEYESVRVCIVEHVDTKEGIVVADAIRAPKYEPFSANVAVEPGVTRQVWLAIHATGKNWGWPDARTQCDGRIEVCPLAAEDSTQRAPTPSSIVPFSMRVEHIDFPKQPALSLGMWDYADEPYAYGITKANQPLAIADMKAHFVDSPWAHSSVIGHPEKKHLDADGNLKPGSIDFTRFDRWLNDWKDARRYFVFLSVGTSLAGFEMGSPQFNKLVGQWFTAWAEHCRKRGLKPKQLGVLLVDEPGNDEQDRRILAWAKPIKAATDFFCIWIDPTHHKLGTPDQVAMLEACDAICPNVSMFYELGARAKEFYGKLCANGRREFWFYWCSGPARQLDPYSYHRMQAWHCWVNGAVGMGFWAYGDTGHGNSWCEYLSPGTSFCPAYISPDSVTTSKHWEAVREGVEDYEYLHMLKQRIDRLTQAGKTSPDLDKAGQLLVEGPKRVAKYDHSNWFTPKDRSLADAVRLEVLDALVNLPRE